MIQASSGTLDAVERAMRELGVGGGCFEIAFPAAAPRSLRLVARGINWRTRRFTTATGDQGIFLRRAVFEAIGGYRDLPLMEDIALFVVPAFPARCGAGLATRSRSGRRGL
jgi:hypothetical protein